jgi:hypothetical protein
MKMIARLLLAALFGLLIGYSPVASADNKVEALLEEADKAAQKRPSLPKRAEQPTPQETAPSSLEIQRMYWQNLHEQRLKEEQNEIIEVAFVSVLALSSLIICLFYLRHTPGFNADQVVNITGLIFIISGTIILVLMAKTEQQLTAAIGILGAVAGYLFGTLRRDEKRAPKREDDKSS